MPFLSTCFLIVTATRKKYMEHTFKKWDSRLLFFILLFTIWGAVTFFSVSSPISQRDYGNSYAYELSFLSKNVLLGTCAFLIFSFLSWRSLRKISLPLFLLTFLFVLGTFIPGIQLGGESAHRWVNLGFISFQPSEFLKFSFLLWFAFFIPQIRREFQSSVHKGLVVIGIISLVSLFVYLQPTLSTLLIMWVSLMVAYISLKPNVQELMPFFIVIGIFLVFSLFWGYRVDRITSFLSGGSTEVDYQKNQSQLAVGSGGLLGKGLGNSKVKLIGLPLMISDSIFSVYAEEVGFIGSVALIGAWLFFIWHIVQKAERSRDQDKRFFAYGVAAWLSLQAFIHIASNIGVMPTTGIPLPFFSYGSSSQIALMAALGVINGLEYS